MEVTNILDNECEPSQGVDFDISDDIYVSNEIEMADTEHDTNDAENHTNVSQSVENLHARVPIELIPDMNMIFENENSAKEFYKTYAKAAGFGVRVSRAHTKVIEGKTVVLDRIFCCNREGERQIDIRDASVKSHRALTRCNCKAEMKISCRETGEYRVVRFIPEHSHHCVSPDKSHLFRSHRKVSDMQKAEIDKAISCGLSQKQTMELMAKQVGGPEYLGFTADDCKNYLRTKRMHEMEMSDTRGVLEYLQGKQADDPNFIYAIQIDVNGMITNIFWADAKMRSDYHHFGDVVCFDTTYRKHKDGRPIALFVGVNNHGQTVIFGAALLYDETIPTFKWLFNTFARTMSNKKPQTILTDQDAAMKNALAATWPAPGTIHRLCVWHINKNAARHLSDVFKRDKNFAKDFSSCIYDHDDEIDFINAWNVMLEKYSLQNNSWLDGIFQIRKQWALVYGRETFCANMSTTQRSESMNNAIKNYINYKHSLSEFFGHFERLVKNLRYKESKADFHADQSKPASSNRVQILKHAASIYTHKIFGLFEAEVYKSHDCEIETYAENDSMTTYNVSYFGNGYISRSHRVTYDSKYGSVSCGCKKFYFSGILCAHALRVLSHKRIVTIPDQYIKKRWTKTAKRGNTKLDVQDMSVVDPEELVSYRYRELSQVAQYLITRAAESKKGHEVAKEGIQRLLAQVDAIFSDSEVQEHGSGTSKNTTDERPENSNPKCKNVRGIKSKEKITYNTSKRPKSFPENSAKKTTKPTNKETSSQININSEVMHSQAKDKGKSVLATSSVENHNLHHDYVDGRSQEIHLQENMRYSFATPDLVSNLHPSENSTWTFSQHLFGMLNSNTTGRNQGCDGRMTNLLKAVDPSVNEDQVSVAYNPSYQLPEQNNLGPQGQ